MNIGYAGNGPLAAATVQRLARNHQVVSLTPNRDPRLQSGVAKSAELARDCDAILLSLDTQAAVQELLLGSQGVANALGRSKIVVDLGVGDPDQTRALSEELAKLGVTLLDAPIHCERSDELSEAAAIMCGGPLDALESIRPVLEAICPNVVYCGESGHGHAAKLVVAGVAACNRLITYECACVGIKSGLAIEHMAAVFNKSSGYNSATARVLPRLGENAQSSDISIGETLEDLKLASQLAMRCGAPLLIANYATSVVEAAVSQLGAAASVDAIARLFEASSHMEFGTAESSPVTAV